MKRKRKRREEEEEEEFKDNVNKKRKIRKVELNKEKARKVLFQDHLKNNLLERKRHSVYRSCLFSIQNIKYLIKKHIDSNKDSNKDSNSITTNEDHLKMIGKILKEYIGVLIEKSKVENGSKTVNVDDLKKVIKKQVDKKKDYLLCKQI